MIVTGTANVRGLLLFDIDGTLLRPGDKAHQRSLAEAMAEVFGAEPSLDGVPLAGMLDSQIARLALERQGIPEHRVRDELPRMMQVMVERYRVALAQEERRSWVLPGIVPLAERLQAEFALAVMTGNASGVARTKLEAAGIAEHFPIGAYGDTAEHRHELVDVAAKAATTRHQVEFITEKMVIIGDTPRDIEAARAAGTCVIAVATGRFSVEDLEGYQPDLLFEHLGAVDEVLAGIDRLLG